MTVIDHPGFAGHDGATTARHDRWLRILAHIARRHACAIPPVVIAAVANTWALTSVGWGNAYYAAAVRSMGSSWHNFLYASFDRGGFVAVDKPPFSLWVQTVATKLFGYSQTSLLVPQALLGTLAVAILYAALTPLWGRLVAALAATGLALTPIAVMVNHSNNTDATLVFLMVAGAALALKAARAGSLRWLLAAAAVSGTAMTAKMLAAVPLMPAVLLAYLWCAPRRWTIRLRDTLLGLVVLAIASLWWFALVDLTPASSRPYVGSSQTNSAFQLAFERNGVNQVEGGQVFGGSGGRGLPGGPGRRGFPGGPGGRGPGGADGRGGAGGRGGFGIPRLGFNGGVPGALRLLNTELGTQAGWLLPFAAVGVVLTLVMTRLRASARLASVIVFGGWAVLAGGVFSVTKGIVHPYYLSNVGPPVAALAGIGIGASASVAMRRRALSLVFVVSGVAATAVTQWMLLRRADVAAWRPALRVVVIVVGVAAMIMVAAAFVRRSPLGARIATAAVAGAALLAPAAWTQGAVAASLTGPLPYADPLASSGSNAGGLRPNGGFTFLAGDQRALVAYLRANRHGERWAVAVSSAAQAETLIIEHDQSVMAMGGFSGSDPILTEASLRHLIATGKVRFFLQSTGGSGPFGGGPFGGTATRPSGPTTGPTLGGLLPGAPTTGASSQAAPPNGGFRAGGFGPGGFGGSNASSFVSTECVLVPASKWQTGSASTGDTSFAGGPSSAAFSLYDCAGLRSP